MQRAQWADGIAWKWEDEPLKGYCLASKSVKKNAGWQSYNPPVVI